MTCTSLSTEEAMAVRLDRLLGITLELMAKKRVTAAQLAGKFEVSVRTVYRDVELINQAGIPVASFTGADGGFELMNGFFLTRQHFSLEDLSVIYSLLKAMEGAMGGTAASAMRKLASLHPALANEGSHEAVILSMDAPEQLKASSGGKTLTIRLAAGTDPAGVCGLLASEHGVAGQANEDGSIVKVAVQETGMAHAVIGTLLGHGAAIDDFTMGDPSLDDVFFALTAAHGKEASSA
ncbi:HTH domain-containing protein [Paenibacillus macerans]